ncbi:MAG: hypothetical protein ACYC1M_00085 [Armatimonadota bacterium]
MRLRIFELYAWAILALGLCHAAGATAVKAPSTIEFFPGDAFLRGFLVSPPMIAREMPFTDFNQLKPMKATGQEPFWSVAQWYCVKSLSETDRKISTKRESSWQSEYESMRVLVDNQGRPELQMEIDSLAIYNHEPISYDRMQTIRPHYLLYRDFFPYRDGKVRLGVAEEYASTFPAMNTFKSLKFKVKLKLIGAKNLSSQYKGDQIANWRGLYNRNGFFLWFKVVDCRKGDTALPSNFGKTFWLGCQVYDDFLPYPLPVNYSTDLVMSDGESFAYGLSYMTVLGKDYLAKLDDFAAGKETEINIDVLEVARKAIQAMQTQKQAFLDVKPDLSGFKISHFNIGWELKSPFRGNIAIRELSLKGVMAKDVKKPGK